MAAAAGWVGRASKMWTMTGDGAVSQGLATITWTLTYVYEYDVRERLDEEGR